MLNRAYRKSLVSNPPEFALLALGFRCLGLGLTPSAFSEPAPAPAIDLLTTVEDDGVGESGLLFSSPELLPVDPELTPLELFRTGPLLEPLGSPEKNGIVERVGPKNDNELKF